MPSPDPLIVSGAPPQVRLSAHGWTSHLTLVVLAGLALETATGLWTLFAPFLLLGQFQVLLHTVAGLLLLTPYVAYQLRHWRDWSDQTLSVVKVLGYAALILPTLAFLGGWEARYPIRTCCSVPPSRWSLRSPCWAAR